jgi:hypothetical protein
MSSSRLTLWFKKVVAIRARVGASEWSPYAPYVAAPAFPDGLLARQDEATGTRARVIRGSAN